MKASIFTLLILAFAFFGCSPSKDSSYNYKRTVVYLSANPIKGGKICGTLYPPIESLEESDSLVQGVPTIVNNNVDVDLSNVISGIRNRLHDSLACALLDSLMHIKLKVPCPPSVFQTNTNYQKTKAQTVNKGLLISAEEVSKTQSEKIIVQSVWLKIFGIYSAIVTAYFILKLLLLWQRPGIARRLF